MTNSEAKLPNHRARADWPVRALDWHLAASSVVAGWCLRRALRLSRSMSHRPSHAVDTLAAGRRARTRGKSADARVVPPSEMSVLPRFAQRVESAAHDHCERESTGPRLVRGRHSSADRRTIAGGTPTRSHNLASSPDAQIFIDRGGREAARFGATTSGMLMFFDAAGTRRYAGGITIARGHEGQSAGADALSALLPRRSQSTRISCPCSAAALPASAGGRNRGTATTPEHSHRQKSSI